MITQTPHSVETSTVFITASRNRFRVWYNPAGYWQTDVFNAELGWLYFSCASTLIAAMSNVAVTL